MSTVNSDDADVGILDMGVAVSVNDTARRTIVAEIKEIEQYNNATKEEIDKEKQVRAELENTSAKAKLEVAGMLDKTNESWEAVKFNQQILDHNQTTFKKEVVDDDPTVAGLRDTLAQAKAATQSIHSKLQTLGENAQKVRSSTKQWNEVTVAIQQKALADQLKVEEANAIHRTRQLEEEVQQATKRLDALKAKRQATEARNEATKTRLSEKAKQIKKIKAGHAAKERDLQKQLEASNASHASKVQELSNLETKLVEFQQSHKTLQGDLEEAQRLIASRELTQKTHNGHREERNKLFVQANDLQKDVADLKEKTSTKQHDLKNRQSELEKLTDLEAAVDATKVKAELETKTDRLAELDKAIEAAESIQANKSELEDTNGELEQVNQDIAKAVRLADHHSKTLVTLVAEEETEVEKYEESVQGLEAERPINIGATDADYKVASRRYKILKHGASILDSTLHEEELAA